jgi:hypothetical protein
LLLLFGDLDLGGVKSAAMKSKKMSMAEPSCCALMDFKMSENVAHEELYATHNFD